MTFRTMFRATIRQFVLRAYPISRAHPRPGYVQLVCGIALISLLVGPPAQANPITLYSNTQDTLTATGFGGTNRSVLIDDVLVPTSRNPLGRPLAITSVSVLVSGLPGEEDELSLWHYPVERDGTPGFARTLVDTVSVTLPSPFPFSVVRFGDGSTPLFTVSPDYSIEPGFGSLFLGIGSSGVMDWQWADGPDVNRPSAYNHRLDIDRIFLNTSPGPPFPPHVSYYLEIEGSPVPEPSTLAQILASLLVGSLLISVTPLARRASASGGRFT